MRISSGVRLNGLNPEALLGLTIVSEMCSKFNFDLDEVLITSVTDANHNDGEFLLAHRMGMAFDIKLPAIVEPDSFILAIKAALGEQFFVHQDGTSIHISFTGVCCA